MRKKTMKPVFSAALGAALFFVYTPGLSASEVCKSSIVESNSTSSVDSSPEGTSTEQTLPGGTLPAADTNFSLTHWMHCPDSNTRQARQGAAAACGILFQFHNANDVVDIIDLNTKQKLQEIHFPAIKEHHCNNVNFSTQKYDKRDKFPLLYVSTERGSAILVYRVLLNNGKYDLQKVQTITIPSQEELGIYYPNSIIDGKHKALWLSGYSRNSFMDNKNGNHLRYVKFPLPDFHKDAKIEVSQKIDEFTTPWVFATQGVVYFKGKFYHSCGVHPGDRLLRIINPKKKKIERVLYTAPKGMTAEPEGTFIYNHHVMAVTIKGDVYQFNF